MFRFLKSLFTRDEGLEAVPLLPEEEAAPAERNHPVVDIDGLIAQASSRVPVGRLRRLGQKVVSLLSRKKIDELVNQAIRRFVERTGRVPSEDVLPGALHSEIRKEFDGLLAQYLGSTLEGQPSSGETPLEIIDGRPNPAHSLDRLELEPGRGLHIETRGIVSAGRMKSTGEIVIAGQQNAFLHVQADESTKKMLRQLELGFVAHGSAGYIVGDPAIELGKIFDKTPRRPMQGGTLAPDEPVALFILSLLLRQVIGTPEKEGEICVYSVPADPIEPDRNFIYHLGAVESALKALGYSPRPMTECHLLVSTELKDQDFSGVGVSCGAGMTNIGIAYKGLPVLGFSISRGGDWIDASVAEALGMPAAEVGRIRAGGMNLQSPNGRIEGALAIYTRTLVHSWVDALKTKLTDAQSLPSFGRPIPVVCAGATVSVPGFLELFKEEIEQARLPIRIDYLRLARDPEAAIAHGCLEAALEETRAEAQAGPEHAPAALERAAVSGVPKVGLPSLSKFRKSIAG
jgi:hypothetical protein